MQRWFYELATSKEQLHRWQKDEKQIIIDVITIVDIHDILVVRKVL